jgi:uncharacterized Zn finger protein
MSWWRTAIDTPCTVAVEHSNESLHAHVELDGDLIINPGDRVRVHGAPIRIAFGERIVERRMATVERANGLERLWTRIAGHFDMTELYEVSFSPRRTL